MNWFNPQTLNVISWKCCACIVWVLGGKNPGESEWSSWDFKCFIRVIKGTKYVQYQTLNSLKDEQFFTCTVRLIKLIQQPVCCTKSSTVNLCTKFELPHPCSDTWPCSIVPINQSYSEVALLFIHTTTVILS